MYRYLPVGLLANLHLSGLRLPCYTFAATGPVEFVAGNKYWLMVFATGTTHERYSLYGYYNGGTNTASPISGTINRLRTQPHGNPWRDESNVFYDFSALDIGQIGCDGLVGGALCFLVHLRSELCLYARDLCPPYAMMSPVANSTTAVTMLIFPFCICRPVYNGSLCSQL